MAAKKKRAEALPAHVKTAHDRETSQLATSPAVLKTMEAKRGASIVVPPTVKFNGTRRLSVKELMDLRIDTTYQREEVGKEVNDLIVVILKGGMIPDPISYVTRKYGDGGSYIVDGQQRWWAHVDTGTPILATEYIVHNYEEEVAMFHVFNVQTRVSPEDRLRSLPGPLGDTIRRLNEDESSPLYSRISYAAGSNGVGAMILTRGLTALIGNISAVGGLERVYPTYDRVYKTAPRKADEFVDAYAKLIALVFSTQRLTHGAAIGLGRVCYAAWTKHGSAVLPGETIINRLARVNWQELVPSHSMKYLPIVLEKITSIWPVELIKLEKK